MVQNPSRLDLICIKITTGRLTAERKRNRDCDRYMEDCVIHLLERSRSALTKTAEVFLECIGPHLWRHGELYRQ